MTVYKNGNIWNDFLQDEISIERKATGCTTDRARVKMHCQRDRPYPVVSDEIWSLTTYHTEPVINHKAAAGRCVKGSEHILNKTETKRDKRMRKERERGKVLQVITCSVTSSASDLLVYFRVFKQIWFCFLQNSSCTCTSYELWTVLIGPN